MSQSILFGFSFFLFLAFFSHDRFRRVSWPQVTMKVKANTSLIELHVLSESHGINLIDLIETEVNMDQSFVLKEAKPPSSPYIASAHPLYRFPCFWIKSVLRLHANFIPAQV